MVIRQKRFSLVNGPSETYLHSTLGAVATGLGGLLGYSSGGYTGNAPKDRVAGVVHGGEYVFSKRAVDRIGVGALEAMHKGTRGFMSGGLVPGCEGGAEIEIERKKK